MKLLKKILAGVLAVTTVISLGAMAACDGCGGNEEPAGNSSSSGGGATVEEQKQTAFIDSIGGVSETYVSGVSAEKYDTNAKAAEAYVQEQVVGTKAATIVNTTSKGTLNQTEIAALKIPATESEGIQSVEKIEVEYTEKESTGILPTAAASSETKKVEIYIIKYPTYFKYYTPCPVTGQTINKSYYDSVFDAQKYKNCTLSSTVTMTIEATNGTETQTVSMETTQLIKFSENAIYLEISMKMDMLGVGTPLNEDTKTYAYIVQEGETISCSMKEVDNLDPSNNTVWSDGSIGAIGFDDLEELAPFADQYLDYTYFTKSDFGFELTKENAQQYINESLGDSMVSMFGNGGSIDMFAKYYVSGGVLSGMRMDLNMNITAQEAGNTVTGEAVMVAETKVTNYGTTTVTKPF